MKKWFVGLILLLSVSFPLFADQSQDITRIVEKVRPAVVFIYMAYGGSVFINGQTVGPFMDGGTGTGFFVNPDGYIITAGHMAQFPTDEEIGQMIRLKFAQALAAQQAKTLGREATQEDLQQALIQSQQAIPVKPFIKTLTCYTRNFKKFTPEVLQLSPWYGTNPGSKDIAILKIPATNMPTAPLGNSDDATDGMDLWVLGYPGIVSAIAQSGEFAPDQIFNPTLTKGVVSARQLLYQGVNLIQTSAQSMGGNSGGPAFTNDGKVVGVCSFGPKVQEGSASAYTYFVPINEALVFVRESGFTPHSSITDTLYQQALTFYWDKSYKKSLSKIKSLLDLLPDHPDAQALQTKLTVDIERTKGKFPVGLVIIIVLVLIVIAAAVVVVPRMAKAKPKAAAAAGGGYLLVETGPSAGKRFELKKETKIGRDANASQIVLSDNVVSRQHAVITPAPDGTKIRQLSTTNPTLVNGQAITETILKDGDRIKIGSTVFVYKTQ